MELKKNLRDLTNNFVYDDAYTLPDQSMTIGDLIERHMDIGSVSNHESEMVEDTNVEFPMRYDSDLTDIPTVYQDGEYFNMLETARRSFVDGSQDPNPKNLNSNEKGITDNSKGVPMDQPTGQSS